MDLDKCHHPMLEFWVHSPFHFWTIHRTHRKQSLTPHKFSFLHLQSWSNDHLSWEELCSTHDTGCPLLPSHWSLPGGQWLQCPSDTYDPVLSSASLPSVHPESNCQELWIYWEEMRSVDALNPEHMCRLFVCADTFSTSAAQADFVVKWPGQICTNHIYTPHGVLACQNFVPTS